MNELREFLERPLVMMAVGAHHFLRVFARRDFYATGGSGIIIALLLSTFRWREFSSGASASQKPVRQGVANALASACSYRHMRR